MDRAGAKPYPCRYVITSKGVDQAPQFTMEIRDWKAGTGVAGADFTFTPPAGAKRMDIKDLKALKETSDLPENYRIGDSTMTKSSGTASSCCWPAWSACGTGSGQPALGHERLQHRHAGRSAGGASAHTGQRGGRGAAHDPALRSRRL